MGTRINVISNHNHEWRLLKMDKKHNACKHFRRKVFVCTYVGCKARKHETLQCPCQKLPGKKQK